MITRIKYPLLSSLIFIFLLGFNLQAQESSDNTSDQQAGVDETVEPSDSNDELQPQQSSNQSQPVRRAVPQAIERVAPPPVVP